MRLFDYIHQGGLVMYVLLFLNIIGFALLFWKIFTILDAKKQFHSTVKSLRESLKTALGSGDTNVGMNLLKDEVQMTVHKLESGLNTIKIIASIAPLLGLLGTVLGILSAFRVIADAGLSNPALFAGGISMALITTVGGLIVAIPHFVGYNYLVGALDDYEIQLEKTLVKEVYGAK
ncbi:MAG: MotA/TolQ/ExbB proton channel family protein [Halobacteriovoraceae bacterium]|jgi:biopolymer transport protein ExbB|nr:MotA/TolQ/ExbB proton channel family protein [Halobacteriovoraceae bacterium]